MASLGTSPSSHFAGSVFLLGWVQQYILSAREPFKLMILGLTFIMLALRLRQRTSPEGGESHGDASVGGTY